MWKPIRAYKKAFLHYWSKKAWKKSRSMTYAHGRISTVPRFTPIFRIFTPWWKPSGGNLRTNWWKPTQTYTCLMTISCLWNILPSSSGTSRKTRHFTRHFFLTAIPWFSQTTWNCCSPKSSPPSIKSWTCLNAKVPITLHFSGRALSPSSENGLTTVAWNPRGSWRKSSFPACRPSRPKSRLSF